VHGFLLRGPLHGLDARGLRLRTVAATCRESRICTFHLVTVLEMPSASHSWKAFVPMADVATWPLMHRIGTESLNASRSPVVVLLMPGPEVTKTTPTRPVLLA
jgi:hypothetical protein